MLEWVTCGEVGGCGWRASTAALFNLFSTFQTDKESTRKPCLKSLTACTAHNETARQQVIQNKGENMFTDWWFLRILTHWGCDKMAGIFQMTFSNAFSWMKMIFEFWIQFDWSLFLRVQLTISHYLNQWWPRLLTHICVTQPQWVTFYSVLVFLAVLSSGVLHTAVGVSNLTHCSLVMPYDAIDLCWHWLR